MLNEQVVWNVDGRVFTKLSCCYGEKVLSDGNFGEFLGFFR